MKWILVSVMGLVTCAAFLLYGTVPALSRRQSPAASRNHAALQVPERKIDFGTVPEGQIVRAAFHLENTRNQAVKVLRILPSCACLICELDKSTLGPGENAELKITLDSGGKPGSRTGNVLVEYRRPDETTPDSIRLFLTGRVLAEATLVPAYHDFGEVVYGKQYSLEVQIVSEIHPQLEIAAVTGHLNTYAPPGGSSKQEFNDQVSVAWRSLDPGACELTLVFSPRPGLSSGSGSCMISFSDANIPARSLGFRWAIGTPVVFSRPAIVGRARDRYVETLVVSPKEGRQLEPFTVSLHMRGAEMTELPAASASQRLLHLRVAKPTGGESVSGGYLEFVFRDAARFPMQRLPIAVTWFE